ncbi:MAG: M48 family metallopeptidase [Verrucomicrobiota bacterium]
MDFFEHQDLARKRTRKLVIYFCISVIMTMVAMYAATALILSFFVPENYHSESLIDYDWFALLTNGLPLDIELMLLVFILTGAVIFLGSSIKTFELSKGGKAVAILLGGKQILPNTQDQNERKLLNIVEEMSIASGCPVPDVYQLPKETSINAFAAGFGLSDATIGVTRGTVELLSRDELQGVIAHEFSHILNGDMRLNMQMTCLTHGILFIAEIGEMMLTVPARTNFYLEMLDNPRSMAAVPFIIAILLGLGTVIWLIGSVGYFFAQLIKSAVSRQREFLADAAAIQFTRNPQGLGMALKKVGGLSLSGKMQSSHSIEASHFFFANGLSSSWFQLFATHPPLTERIKIIDPSFDGIFPKVEPIKPLTIKEQVTQQKKARERAGIFVNDSDNYKVAGLVASAGQISRATIDAAFTLTQSLPKPLYEAAHEPFGARAVAYGLLLSEEPEVLNYQRQLLQQKADAAVLTELEKLHPEFEHVEPRQRLVLIDLALPALRQLSPDQYQIFRQIVSDLAAADQAISLFEYCLEKVLVRHLDPAFTQIKPATPTVHNLIPVWQECMQLLGALAYLDSDTYEEAQAAFDAGASQLNLANRSSQLPPQEEAGLVQVDRALDACAGLTPMHKRNLLFACSQVVLKFRGCDDQEAELIRAIADTLDCPLPPFVADQMA